jgi:hypothetical protein
MHSALLEVVSFVLFVTVLKVSFHTLDDLAAGKEQMHRIVMLYVLCQFVFCDYIMKCLNLTVTCSLKL